MFLFPAPEIVKDLVVDVMFVAPSVERPVHYSESVVELTMRWARWPEEYRHGNYLVVKEAAVYSEIEQVVRLHSSLSLCLSVRLSVCLSVRLSLRD